MRIVEVEGRRIRVYGFWEFRQKFKTRLKWHMDWMKHLIAAYAFVTGYVPANTDEAIHVLHKFTGIAPFYIPLLTADPYRIRRLVQELRREIKEHGIEGFVQRWYTLLVAEAKQQHSRR